MSICGICSGKTYILKFLWSDTPTKGMKKGSNTTELCVALRTHTICAVCLKHELLIVLCVQTEAKLC